MELKSLTSSLFLHAGKDLALSPNQRLYTVPLLLTGNTPVFPAGITIPMDDIGKIPYMVEFAETLGIEDPINWLLKTWNAT